MAENSNVTAAADPNVNKRQYKFVIEVGDDMGRNPVFSPLKRPLRGRWGKTILQHNKGTDALMKMPDLPGLYIEIDMERRAGRIFDPLDAPEHKQTVAAAQGPYKEMVGTGGAPWPESVYKNMSETDMKTWVYWMFRMLTDPTPSARLVGSANVVPRSAEEIDAMPGKTRIEQYNSSARANKTIEDARAAALKV